MNFELKSDRLSIRDIRVSDFAFVLELLNDPAFIQNIGDRQIRTQDQARTYISSHLISSYTQHGFGMYLVQLHDGTPLGMCGILKRSELDSPDIGFAFLENFRSKGFAYEASKAVLDDYNERWNYDNLYGICKQENMDSRKLLQRLGLHFSKMITYKGEENTCLYALKYYEPL